MSFLPESDDGSTADERAPLQGAGFWCPRATAHRWRRQVVGNWKIASTPRLNVGRKLWNYFGHTQKPFRLHNSLLSFRWSASLLAQEIIEIARSHGLELHRSGEDRQNIPTDFRFMQLVLNLADDPEIGIGAYSPGVRVGPGIRMPRLPALYRPKRRWRLSGGGTFRFSPRWKNRYWKSYMIRPQEDRSSYCRNWKPRSNTLRRQSVSRSERERETRRANHRTSIIRWCERPGGEQENTSPGPGTRVNRCRLEEIDESESSKR